MPKDSVCRRGSAITHSRRQGMPAGGGAITEPNSLTYSVVAGGIIGLFLEPRLR